MEDKLNKNMKCKYCKQEKKTKFPDGVVWNTLGVDCKCGQEIIPVADNKGEDCNLRDEMDLYRGSRCTVCGEKYGLIVETKI